MADSLVDRPAPAHERQRGHGLCRAVRRRARCAKVSKRPTKRGFLSGHETTPRGRSEQPSGARVAKARAMAIRSRRRRGSAEVDMARQLARSRVRAHCYDPGACLLMELVADGDGEPAPRLSVVLDRRMRGASVPSWCASSCACCAGIVHGDLSGIQRAGRSRRAGDHRSAAGGGCGGQQQRPRRTFEARCRQPRRLLRADSPPTCSTPRQREDLGLVRVGQSCSPSALTGSSRWRPGTPMSRR